MDIKAQAELRRKRILANAEARLKKITSRTSEKIDISKVPEDPVIVPPINGSTCNIHSLSEEQNHQVIPEIGSFNEEDRDRIDRLNELTFQDNHESLRKSSILGLQQSAATFRYECYFYLSLGVVVRFLFYVGFSWFFLDNILGPFILPIIPRIFGLYGSKVQPTGVFAFISSTSALLARDHHQKVYSVVTAVTTFRTILQFFALYLFSFILADYILCDRES